MKLLTAAACIAAVLVSAATSAMAKETQHESNQNLRAVSNHIEHAIDALQSDVHDYGGHRAKAVTDLQTARTDIASALDYWRSHGAPPVPEVQVSPTFPPTLTQAESNENLRVVRNHIETAVEELQGDRWDYGGYKEQAIQALQSARDEIDQALQYWYQTVHGGTMASDANLNYVDGHIQAAITSLQGDRHDYGGHRSAALGDLQTANTDIQDALSWQHSHADSGGGPGGAPAAPGAMSAMPMQTAEPAITQNESNDSLINARIHVEKAIDALNRDSHDYNGFRAKAVTALQAAHAELIAAIQYRASH
ncbi:MAG TPA: hypothetical protein VEJ20_10355 [Candidatus Eremiobacteraceae bacterium]|nr:hypothetical protein [Candidatus Eremiobacteraceae bacterium]